MPLMEPPPSHSATSSPEPERSTRGEMDTGESVIYCTFPELLARDLEISVSTPKPKAMTAGYPSMGCASPSVDVPRSTQTAVRRASYRHHLLASRRHLHSLANDEADSHLQPRDGGGQRRKVKGGSLDSFSVMSVMEPPSIRTREQSVTTTATSLSGRCSSLFSHSPISPSRPTQSPCSSNSRPHGDTWYEAEADPQEPASPSFTDTSSLYETHQGGLDMDDENNLSSSRTSSDSFGGNGETSTRAHEAHSARESWPGTPCAQICPKKARIVDIPPAGSTPKPAPPLKSGRSVSDPAPAKDQEAVNLRASEILEWQAGNVVASQTDPMVHIPFVSVPNGRTVIDASGPPSRGSARRSHRLYRAQTCSHGQKTISEHQGFQSREASDVRSFGAVLSRNKTPSVADLRAWIDESAETLAPPQNIASCSPAISSAGIPLPPEVIESLRVSISCFPETMLLTSSLSIETIRAYSKKVKHRADLDRSLKSNESQSLYSMTSSNNARPGKRWNLTWLGQNRRISHQQQQQYPAFLGDMPNPSLGRQSFMAPSWTPIKNIFPAATDYLCDALYAHLLAYNYVTSLCPPPRPAILIPPRTCYRHRHHQPGSRGASIDDTAARNLNKVPHKAASLLGMDDPISAATYLYQQRQQQQLQHEQQRPKTRRLLSRRSGAAPANDSFPFFSAFGAAAAAATATATDGSNGGPRPEAAASAAMREIRDGLARCIGLLVATLKRTGAAAELASASGAGVLFGNGNGGDAAAGAGGCGGGGWDGCGGKNPVVVDREPSWLIREQLEEGMVGAGYDGDGDRVGIGSGNGEAERVEPVLMRALCEVVRCAEESLSA